MLQLDSLQLVGSPRAAWVVELESGEKNPQVETLVKIAAATGLEFAIDIAPAGQEPKLVGKTVKDALKCRFFADGASRSQYKPLCLVRWRANMA